MKLKTYSHLSHLQKIPDDYEISTSQLHYYPELGFETELPLKQWYLQNQNQSRFKVSDWSTFSDPARLHYSNFIDQQSQTSQFVLEILGSMTPDYDRALPADWIHRLEFVIPQLRYVFHSLQMTSAYVGSMSPNSQLTITNALEAANQMKVVQICAYRTRLLQSSYPGFGQQSQATWENNSQWQPIRKALEILLTTYDWLEAFVASELVIKPKIDQFLFAEFYAEAQVAGDSKMTEILNSLKFDQSWRTQWVAAAGSLLKTQENTDVLSSTIHQWQQLTNEIKI